MAIRDLPRRVSLFQVAKVGDLKAQGISGVCKTVETLFFRCLVSLCNGGHEEINFSSIPHNVVVVQCPKRTKLSKL